MHGERPQAGPRAEERWRVCARRPCARGGRWQVGDPTVVREQPPETREALCHWGSARGFRTPRERSVSAGGECIQPVSWAGGALVAGRCPGPGMLCCARRFLCNTQWKCFAAEPWAAFLGPAWRSIHEQGVSPAPRALLAVNK